jgi:hypothetical protein
VSDSPTTPRTPEMLIFRVGIARILNKIFHAAAQRRYVITVFPLRRCAAA